ncbi:MAG TPA: SxtJ family membrane protein, partial [Candidatus Hydrogenedentes bacterium]|nr:SxtJ family membrane protein [Candidatus Hydrogenedentota bacterium]
MHIDIRDKSEQRKFGVVMAVAVTALGLLRWGLHAWRGHAEGPPYYFLAVAAVFLLLGLATPFLLRPVLFLWLKLSLAVNWVMTRVLLSLVFFLMITPGRILIRLFGQDPLKREWP